MQGWYFYCKETMPASNRLCYFISFVSLDVLTISQVQVGAISSFILSRNHFTNGDLAMALGVWHFAAKSHINVKHVYNRFGNIVLPFA